MGLELVIYLMPEVLLAPSRGSEHVVLGVENREKLDFKAFDTKVFVHSRYE
jgi:hypothetical protein